MFARLQSSLTLKLFLASFVSTHLPLLAALAYYGFNRHLDPLTTVGLLLAATVAGTALCLGSLWLLLHPLRQLRIAVGRFRESRGVCELRSKRRDEVGLIINAFTSLTTELSRTISTLEHQATSDVVTGLRNRRWLIDNAALAIARARRERTKLSVIVMDIDHFKSINDRFGHDAGDRALMAAGAVVLSCLRPYDLAARIGGEEFAVLLPGCDRASAEEIANRIRSELETAAVLPNKARLTASFGVYEADVESDTLSAMLKAGDANLYRAKRAGRNRVVSQLQPKDDLEVIYSRQGSKMTPGA